ncbi:two-component sensor histidine kinase [Flavobacterium faecale]|uniref:histidine kinase n=1 Tax=Flavobacterium faecale TaxID=1355330 RepID=A0A2S1LCS7_9FLAO|nr:ATP-binding protein [Flavobacterium faecale]AWG21549.1 two-component sensor histidine kinase [Flavobacterium faecale]
MKAMRYFLLLLLFIFHSTNSTTYSQTTKPTKEHTLELVRQSTRLMLADKNEESLIMARKALEYSILINNNELIANSYNTIAANFDEITEFEKAFFYYKKGLFYAEKTNNDKLKNWLNNNIGNIYCFDKKEYSKGIAYYKKSLIYSAKAKDTTQLVFTKLNITWAYFDIGAFDKGLPYLQYINKYHPKFGNELTEVAINMLNGMYSSYVNDNAKAEAYFKKGIEVGQSGDEKSDLSFTHLEYSKFLSKNKEFEKAYQNLKIYNKLTTELNDEEKLKKANLVGINLQIDEYKREIDNIESKYKTKEQSLLDEQTKNKRLSVIIISTLLIFIILFYFFFQNNKLKQKNSIKDIQSTIQLNIINANINGQEFERKKIASFLHDNISALLSSADMHLSVLNAKSETKSEELIKTKSILRDAHDKIRDLSHELLPSLLARFGLYFALHDLCEKNSNSSIHFEYICIEENTKRYHEDFELKMYFIITELLNNIIKHSNATHAKLKLAEIENILYIHITDNGQGFDTKKFMIIEGFGLNQIRARIKNMHGKISINSAMDSGTSISIKAPITFK